MVNTTNKQPKNVKMRSSSLPIFFIFLRPSVPGLCVIQVEPHFTNTKFLEIMCVTLGLVLSLLCSEEEVSKRPLSTRWRFVGSDDGRGCANGILIFRSWQKKEGDRNPWIHLEFSVFSKNAPLRFFHISHISDFFYFLWLALSFNKPRMTFFLFPAMTLFWLAN